MVAVGLVLLYPAYLVAQIVVPLALGFLFPWEPPVAETAPSEAVPRVLVPEGETYQIEWGQGFGRETEEAEALDPDIETMPFQKRRWTIKAIYTQRSMLVLTTTTGSEMASWP